MTDVLEQIIRTTLQHPLTTSSDPKYPPTAQRAWENLQFSPTTGVPWIDSEVQYSDAVMGFRSGPIALGQTSPNRFVGYFNISLFWPNSVGPNDAEYVANLIRKLYPASTPLPYTVNDPAGVYNGELSIIRTTRRQAVSSDTWYLVPIIVCWRTDAPHNL